MKTTIGQAPGFSAPTSESSTRPDKEFSTVQAHAALCGVILHKLEDDRGQTVFIVSRWALTREMRSLEEVSSWLTRFTGKNL